MSKAKIASSPEEEPSSTACWQGGIAALAALADQALSSGDRTEAENLVQAIFAICDMAGTVSRPSGAADLHANKRPRPGSGRRTGSSSGCAVVASGASTMAFGMRPSELVA